MKSHQTRLLATKAKSLGGGGGDGGTSRGDDMQLMTHQPAGRGGTSLRMEGRVSEGGKSVGEGTSGGLTLVLAWLKLQMWGTEGSLC